VSSKILLLEDDKLFNETLQDFLELEGFEIDYALDPYTALDLTYENNYHLYLFDVNLPYENGFDLLKKLRDSQDETPCIFLTSREDKPSLKEGFSVGGDDYIKKPVDLDELLFRINAVLRRQIRTETIVIGEYTFDSINKTLFHKGKGVELSLKAATLLYVLLEAKEKVISVEQIRERLWSTAQDSSDGALRVYITQLKKYFPTQIKNIRGVGYQMKLS